MRTWGTVINPHQVLRRRSATRAGYSDCQHLTQHILLDGIWVCVEMLAAIIHFYPRFFAAVTLQSQLVGVLRKIKDTRRQKACKIGLQHFPTVDSTILSTFKSHACLPSGF